MALLISFSLLETAQAAPAQRTATIQWRPVDQAVKYEFELSKVPEMDPTMLKKEYATTQVKLSLPPGTYYFRVRGVDSKDAPGPWTDVQGFVVNAAPPEIASPAAGSILSKELSDGTLTLEWREGVAGTVHQIEITDEHGATSVWKTSRSELQWKPPAPGIYSWRVGYEGASRMEWSAPARFKIEPAAFPPAEVKTVVEYRETGGETDEQIEAENAKPRRPEWSVVGRGAQAIVAYSTQDIDSGMNASGAAVVSLMSAELRWRGPKYRRQVWTWSAALNFELIRQSVLGTTFSLPRGYARVFYGREYGKWRLGGFVHAMAGKAGIFIVEGATQATRTTVFRQGYGPGVMATYRASPSFFLSAIALGRFDMGGESPDLPNALESSFGFEAGFGVALGINKRLFVEGRLRALQEDFSWRPSAGGTTLSSQTNTFVILDAGLGMKL